MPVYGQRSFNVAAEPLRFIEGADTIRIRAVDWAGNISDPIDLRIAPQPEVAAGEACDLLSVDNRCAEGSFCLDADEGATCVAPSPPAITGGHVWREGQSLTAAIEGTDATRDTFQARGLFLDANGPIPGGDAFLGARRHLRPGVHAPGARAQHHIPMGATSLRVWLQDDRLLESEPRDFPHRGAAPGLGLGDACDPLEVQSLCDGQAICPPARRPSVLAIEAPAITSATYVFDAESGGQHSHGPARTC
ncbi:MAG: hypothetical protein R3F60_27820 [bacterium]